MKSNGTPFRKSQAKYALEGLVRWLAPAMQTPDGLREAVRELAADVELWTELELARADLPEPTSTPTTPERAPVMTAPVIQHGAWTCCSTVMAPREAVCWKCGGPRS